MSLYVALFSPSSLTPSCFSLFLIPINPLSTRLPEDHPGAFFSLVFYINMITDNEPAKSPLLASHNLSPFSLLFVVHPQITPHSDNNPTGRFLDILPPLEPFILIPRPWHGWAHLLLYHCLGMIRSPPRHTKRMDILPLCHHRHTLSWWISSLE